MRSRFLDSLRGIAVVLVLFRHFHVSSFMAEVGWIGVDLFFVLSGFLVSGILFKEYKNSGSIHWLKFLGRRGFKIYPLFWMLLLLTIVGYFVLQFIGRERTLDFSAFWYELLFVQNYFKGVWGHTWSLAVEEHFYLILAVSLHILAKRKILESSLSMIFGIVAILILILGLRVLTWWGDGEFTYRTHFYCTHLRLDSLLFGVLLSYVHNFKRNYFYGLGNRYRILLFLVSGVLLSTVIFWPLGSYEMGTIGLTCLYLGFGVLLWLGVVLEDSNQKSSIIIYLPTNLFAFVGLYSYSIYLFHNMVASFVMPIVVRLFVEEPNQVVLFLVYVSLSLGAGVLSSRLVEWPFLRLRERLLPSESRVKNE